jgi:hypothetical protein
MKNNTGKKKKGKRKYMAWQKLEKNQKEVARRVTWGDYELVHTSGWGFLDDFLLFLEQMEVLQLFHVPGEGYQRKMIPTFLTLLTYGIKIMLGIERMNQVPEFLFKDMGLLKLIGFTYRQIKSGFCERGKERKGPFHKETLADAMERVSIEEATVLFNEAIKKIALPKLNFLGRLYALDATLLLTTEKYPGCGRRTLQKDGKDVTEYGYKLLMVWDVVNRIPVAGKVVQIQEHEAPFMLEMVELATANIGKRIHVLTVDRGFLCGPSLYKLTNTYGIDFIIPSKRGMDITADAQGLYHLSKKHESDEVVAYGVPALTSLDTYGLDSPAPLNAIVVTRWQENVYAPSKEKVFLTSLSVDKPLERLKLYGLRSLIENQGFRELKQGWHLTKFPKKSRQAVVSHVFLTLLMCAMTSAYRSKEGQRLKEKGIRRYRREHLAANKILIIADEYYGIFDIEEYSILMGKPPKIFMRVDPEAFKKAYGLT